MLSWRGWASVTVYAISHFAPRLITRFGARALLVTGSLIVILSLLGFARLDDDSAYYPAVLIPPVIHAIGIAFIFAPGTVAILQGVPEEHTGTASGLLQMDQQIGEGSASLSSPRSMLLLLFPGGSHQVCPQRSRAVQSLPSWQL